MVLSALVFSGVASAEVNCTDPIGDWKPREQLQREAEQRGWIVQRIKIDDGCYELRAIDRNGNKIKAKYSPASLRMRSLAVNFGNDGDTSDYLGPVPLAPVSRPASPTSQGEKK
ncbi:PepSY domain-containing protein [Janthinobacterium sp. UMAB-56]|uniref:PepSY domain-containing protein n=1 Tax=Janthinobacterium sp. UMAB-56 TaxID=1365361 RepID=UPI00214CBEF6|nr:PepSY domain-containing protein [Janthinobacterium sp. UMAB-56]